jgi:mRNA interferase MazF
MASHPNGNDDQTPRRGDVWIAQLDIPRPVIILTRDPMGAHLNALLGVYATRRIRGLTSEVPVGLKDGINFESVVNLDNLQLIDQRDLLERVGQARPETMAAICRALAFVVDCPSIA